MITALLLILALDVAGLIHGDLSANAAALVALLVALVALVILIVERRRV